MRLHGYLHWYLYTAVTNQVTIVVYHLYKKCLKEVLNCIYTLWWYQLNIWTKHNVYDMIVEWFWTHRRYLRYMIMEWFWTHRRYHWFTNVDWFWTQTDIPLIHDYGMVLNAHRWCHWYMILKIIWASHNIYGMWLHRSYGETNKSFKSTFTTQWM